MDMTKKTKKELQAEETRRRLIDSAEAVFLDKGYSGTTISLISSRADTAYSTAYVYFKNKEEMFSIIVDETFQSLYDMAGQDFTPQTVSEAHRIIQRQCRTYLAFALSSREMLLVLEEAIRCSSMVRSKWWEIKAYFIKTITKDIAFSKTIGLIPSHVDARIAAESWYAINEHFLWKLVAEPEHFEVERLAEELTRNYVQSLYHPMLL